MIDKTKQTLEQPVQEPVVLNNGRLTQYPDGSIGVGTPNPAFQRPPQRKPPQFPTMLRKMWSGTEVQEWINENWR